MGRDSKVFEGKELKEESYYPNIRDWLVSRGCQASIDCRVYPSASCIQRRNYVQVDVAGQRNYEAIAVEVKSLKGSLKKALKQIEALLSYAHFCYLAIPVERKVPIGFLKILKERGIGLLALSTDSVTSIIDAKRQKPSWKKFYQLLLTI